MHGHGDLSGRRQLRGVGDMRTPVNLQCHWYHLLRSIDVPRSYYLRRKLHLQQYGVVQFGAYLRDGAYMPGCDLSGHRNLRCADVSRNDHVRYCNMCEPSDVFRVGHLRERADMSEFTDYAGNANLRGYNDVLRRRWADLWDITHMHSVPDVLWRTNLPWHGLM